MRFAAVRLKALGPRGTVHKRTIEPIASGVRSYRAGEVLCNHNWTSDQLESASIAAFNCVNCAKREAEIQEAALHKGLGGVDRPFMKARIDELEKVLHQHKADHAVLGRIREELTYRKTSRAKQLKREVEGLINGLVPMRRKGHRSAQPEDQLGLIDITANK